MTSIRVGEDLDGPASTSAAPVDPGRLDRRARRVAGVLLLVILVVIAVIVFWPGPPDPDGQTALDACFKNAPTAANGLTVGQYVAPVFEFIFPENVKPGDAIVPNDLWHLGFLRSGEGSTTAPAGGPSVGPLTPAPW